MRPYLEELSNKAPFYVSAYPNAGLPNQFGEYDETPESMSHQVCDFLDSGFVNIVGGCCGTTPEHIRHIAEHARRTAPRKRASPPPLLRLSGLEAVTLLPESNFMNVGERTNVTGSKKFLRLIKERKFDEALSKVNKVKNPGFKGLANDLAGDIYSAMGKIDDAKKSYTEALKSLSTKNNLGNFTQEKLEALGV